MVAQTILITLLIAYLSIGFILACFYVAGLSLGGASGIAFYTVKDFILFIIYVGFTIFLLWLPTFILEHNRVTPHLKQQSERDIKN